jgi:hypothetical protein
MLWYENGERLLTWTQLSSRAAWTASSAILLSSAKTARPKVRETHCHPVQWRIIHLYLDARADTQAILFRDTAALTARWLLKNDANTPPRVIVCTGERMESLVCKLYQSFGVRTTSFEPKHARGLSNEFYCYANFEGSSWTWKSG